MGREVRGSREVWSTGGHMHCHPWGAEGQLVLVASLHTGGIRAPSPSNPAVASMSPASPSPLPVAPQGHQPYHHTPCSTVYTGSAWLHPHTWLGVAGDLLCPAGDGSSTTIAPVPCGLPGVPPTPHAQGPSPVGPRDAHSRAGEGFPVSRLAAAVTEPWERWVFGEHHCLHTLRMPHSAQPHGAQWGCRHLGTKPSSHPFPTWLTHALPATATAQGWVFLPPPAPAHPVHPHAPSCRHVFPHLPSPGNIGQHVHPGSLIYSGSA